MGISFINEQNESSREIKNYSYLKTNEKNENERNKIVRANLNWTNVFSKICFYWLIDFIEQTILRENEPKRWKMNFNFENERNTVFKRLKKRNKMDCSRTMNKRSDKVQRAHLYNTTEVILCIKEPTIYLNI